MNISPQKAPTSDHSVDLNHFRTKSQKTIAKILIATLLTLDIPIVPLIGSMNTAQAADPWVTEAPKADPMMQNLNIPANAATQGMWSQVYDWPINSIHLMMLPDGRVLSYGADPDGGGDGRHYDYWDPANGFGAGTHKTKFSPEAINSFCSTNTFLNDGTLMVTSGFNPKESIFIDWKGQKDSLTKSPAMLASDRWYSTLVTLPDSRKVILGGMQPANEPMWLNPDNAIVQGKPSMTPEIYENGQWRTLFGANSRLAFGPDFLRVSYPKAFVAPNGNVFGISAEKMWYMDVNANNGSGAITNVYNYKTGYGNLPDPVNVGSLATAVMYDIGKIIIAGGNGGYFDDGFAASNMATSIDINNGAPVLTELPRMTNPRRMANGNVLATGEVVITGGSKKHNNNGADAVYTAEIWNPKTNTWTQGTNAAIFRGYHGTAILLKNGAILSSGGGNPGPVTNKNAEIYYPPNLFVKSGASSILAQRPKIAGISGLKHAHNANFEFDMSNTETVSSVVLLGMPAATHANSPAQRRIPLQFSQNGKRITSTTPNANLTPPGYYQLVAINAQGVPSYAYVIAVGDQMAAPQVATTTYDPNGGVTPPPPPANVAPTVTLTAPAIGSAYTQSATVAITATAADSDGTVAFVDFYDGGTLLGSDTTAPYAFNWVTSTATTIGSHNITAVATDNAGAKTTSAARSITINAPTNNPTGDSDSDGIVDALDIYPNDATRGAGIWREQYNNIGGGVLVADLTAAAKFPNAPDEVAKMTTFTSPDNIGDNYGSRVRGIFTAPTTGAYTFWVAGDDETRLYLSTNNTAANKTQIAFVPNWSFSNEWTKYPEQKSATINLVAGQHYYLELLQKEGGGGDGAAVAWQTPSNPTLTVMTDQFFQKAGSTVTPPTNTPPTNAVNCATEGGTCSLPAGVTATVWYGANNNWNTKTGVTGSIVCNNVAFGDPIPGTVKTCQYLASNTQPVANTSSRASTAIVFEKRTGANNRVWVVNPDNDSVSVLDAVTNTLIQSIPVGTAPRTLAIAPNGNIWVANKGSASISVISPTTLAVIQTIAQPRASQPFGLAFSPNGANAYVVLEALGQVRKLDPVTGALVATLAVGNNPRHVSVTADSATVLVSRFITPALPGEATANVDTTTAGAEVVAVNAGAMTLNKTIVLKHSNKADVTFSGSGIPNYLGAAVISPDGKTAWVPSKQDNIKRGTARNGQPLNFQNTVRAISSRIDMTTLTEDLPSRIDHDNSSLGSAAVYHPSGNHLFVALETSREVAVIDPANGEQRFRINVGRAPQGLTLSADGNTLYVHEFMDRSVSVVDLTGLVSTGALNSPVTNIIYSVPLDQEKLPANVMLGKQLFYDAKDPRLAQDSYMSCASCHNDGGGDGRVWDLTGFGEGLRNTINLKGRAAMGHGNLHWSANFDELQDFEGQIRALAGGTGLMTDADFNTGTRNQQLGDKKAGISADLDNLAAYVASLNTFAQSPNRNADGTLTTAATAGKTVFANSCASCHGGANFTTSTDGTNLKNIGTINALSGKRLNATLAGIDVPTLRDAWTTAPYLHNGSAATVTAAVQAHNNLTLNATDLANVVAFVQQIGSEEATGGEVTPPPPPANIAPTVAIASPVSGISYVQGEGFTFNANANDSDGSISKVEFYYNTNQLLATLNQSPYTFSGSTAGVPLGNYIITAKAYDNKGAVTTSAPITVTVKSASQNNPPTVAITAPAAGTAITQGATVAITATAADSDGTVAKVEFYDGATLLGTDTTAPYAFNWVTSAATTAGAHSLIVKAYDNAGAVTTSAAVSVTVNASTTTPSIPPASAIQCALEWGATGCVIPSGLTATVWYGTGTTWNSKTNVSGSIACNNIIFGDPIPGTVKVCKYVAN